MELIVKIRQHTPIIHFQWDQSGATLRATEIKPKLDKYIKQLDEYYSADVINQLDKMPDGNNIYSLKVIGSALKEKIIPRVLDKKTKLSKDYDIVEHVSDLEKDSQKMRRSLYFGDVKAMVEYYDGVILRLQSFDKKILAKAFLALPIMLAFENFGSRQNKGFGSFYIDDIPTFSEFPNLKGLYNIEEVYKRYTSNSQNNVYIFDTETKDYLEVFRRIFYFYNALKSGTNEGGTYSKSLLWKYMRKSNPNLIWEKRVMKQRLKGDPLPTPLSSPEYQYIRVLLGFSPTYEFKSTVYKKNGQEIDTPVRMDGDYSDYRTLSISGIKKFIVEDKPDKSDDKIERSNSPITLKPINTLDGYKVYIILKKELLQKVMGRNFSFSEESSDRTINIESPVSFDLNKFMDFAIQEMSKGNVNHFVNGLKITQIIKESGGDDGK